MKFIKSTLLFFTFISMATYEEKRAEEKRKIAKTTAAAHILDRVQRYLDKDDSKKLPITSRLFPHGINVVGRKITGQDLVAVKLRIPKDKLRDFYLKLERKSDYVRSRINQLKSDILGQDPDRVAEGLSVFDLNDLDVRHSLRYDDHGLKDLRYAAYSCLQRQNDQYDCAKIQGAVQAALLGAVLAGTAAYFGDGGSLMRYLGGTAAGGALGATAAHFKHKPSVEKAEEIVAILEKATWLPGERRKREEW